MTFWPKVKIFLELTAVLLIPDGNVDNSSFYFFEYNQGLRKPDTALGNEALITDLFSLINTEFSNVAFPHLPVFFLSFLSSFSCLFHVSSPLPPPLPCFLSFYKSLPVWSHISPAPDRVGRKIKCCQPWKGKTIKSDEASKFPFCCRSTKLLPELEALLTDFWIISTPHWKCFCRV